jgi:hypothetical protein
MGKIVTVYPEELNTEIQELANSKAGIFYGVLDDCEMDKAITAVLKAGAKQSHYALADGIKELINKYSGR